MDAAVTANLPDRVLWIDTASGSRYRIDPFALRWERLAHDPRSGAVRTEGGPFFALAALPALGEPLVIYGPPLDPAADVRIVTTSAVVAVVDEPPEGAATSEAGFWEERP